MKNPFSKLTKYKKYLLLVLGILIVLIFLFFRNDKNKAENYTVTRTNIEQSAVLSGKVEIADKADLGFAASGRVAKINVKNNQSVKEGVVLAQLEIGDLLADLQIKQANSKSSDVSLQSAKDKFEKVTRQENTKVANAYRALLSEGLAPVSEDEDLKIDLPIINGIYEGSEGQYKIIIDKENITLPDYRLLTFGLEKTKQIINNASPTPLGTKGLYISFTDNNFSPYRETIWHLDIPNKSSSFYLSNLNEYNTAKDERDLAIKNAEAEYKKLLAKGDDGSTIAQAEINKIKAEIRKNTIYAPFSGKVTNIEKEVGENAAVGEQVITILGENKLKVVFQVSELDVSRLAIGSTIKIFLDAIPGEEFSGVLKTINSKETEIDGVPVYEAFVELESDPRIKNGMSANGTIILVNKENVLAIPSYFIKKAGNLNLVSVIEKNGDIAEKKIILGLKGSDSMVEVISGLSENEKIVKNTNEK